VKGRTSSSTRANAISIAAAEIRIDSAAPSELNYAGAVKRFGYIVPGSGTGELTGVARDVEIRLLDGVHHIDLTVDL
jgi:hypothetical protein